MIRGIFGLLWKLYIAVIFTATAIFFYPVILPFLFSEKSKKNTFGIFVFWSWVFRVFCFYQVKKELHGRIPEGPYLIVANHVSYLDIFLLPSILPNHHFLFLGKSEILKYPLIKTYFKRLNIPIHRGDERKSARALIEAIRAIKSGWSLMIFPEGGIPDEDNPKMAPFKNGAFLIAKNTGVPIVPVTFLNNHQLFSDPTQVLGQARPGISEVIIHEAITSETIAKMTADELSDYCFQIIYNPLQERYPHLRD